MDPLYQDCLYLIRLLAHFVIDNWAPDALATMCLGSLAAGS